MAISLEDFEKVEMRSGTVIKVGAFPKAKKPSYKVWVDFGDEIGVKQTSAQVTVNYTTDSLLGKQIVGVLNLGARNIAGFTSEFLMLGLEDEKGAVSLITPGIKVPNGRKLY